MNQSMINNLLLCKLSHKDPKIVTWFIKRFKSKYDNTKDKLSGTMYIKCGKGHKYLGMAFDFTTKEEVKITMIPYIKESLWFPT